MPEFQLIDNDFASAVPALLGDADTIGVDTEFVRERTYFAELCLIQVAAAERIACIDPLAGPDDATWEALCRTRWVLHAGRQDIEVVQQNSGLMPAGLFDTQIAAAFLGYQPQIGYAGLVQTLFDITLDKSQTRANWSRRPLDDSLLRYAAADVQYLLPAFETLAERLEKKGRLRWVLADSNDLLDPALYSSDPGIGVQKLKGAKNLTGRSRAAAVALAEWREREALDTNRPRQWIMRDSVLLDIATTRPDSRVALSGIDGLADKTRRRFGERLLDIVAGAGSDTSYRPPGRPDERQKAALKEMQRIVQRVADDMELAAEIIAPRRELSAAMLGDRESRVFNGWRREIVGDALLEVLEN